MKAKLVIVFTGQMVETNKTEKDFEKEMIAYLQSKFPEIPFGTNQAQVYEIQVYKVEALGL